MGRLELYKFEKEVRMGHRHLSPTRLYSTDEKGTDVYMKFTAIMLRAMFRFGEWTVFADSRREGGRRKEGVKMLGAAQPGWV